MADRTTPATPFAIAILAALLAAFYGAQEPCPVSGGYPNETGLCGRQNGQEGHVG